MMRGNVVKTLNKPPMAKKEKPLEATAKIEIKPESIKAIVPKKKK